MSYLDAAIVVLFAATGLHLVFTRAVIRRIREHEEQILALTAGRREYQPGRRPGDRLPDFAAVAVDGTEVRARTMTDGSETALVGLFSARCQPCRELLPAFTTLARERGPAGVLAVVIGDPAQGGDLVDALRGTARVVVEADGGPVGAAFGARSFLAFYLVDADGTVLSTAPVVGALSVPAAA